MKKFIAPRFWPTWLLLGFMWLIARLPYRLQMHLGHGLGLLFYHGSAYRRHITETNIQLCFPSLSADQQAKLIRDSFISAGKGFVETAMAWFGSREKLAPLFSAKGLEHLKKILASGQGILVLNAHFTSLDLVSRMVTFEIPLYFVYREHKNPLFSYFMQKERQQHQADAAIHRDDTRKLIQVLKKGNAVWYAPDQDYGRKHSVFVPFFGVTSAWITATSRLAALTNAAIVPMWCYRREDGLGYEAVFEPALENFPSQDITQDTARIAKCIQQAIEQHPDQYLWQHRRFKTQPDGTPRPYQKKSKFWW